VLSYYRRLIALRHDLPVVAEGDFTLLLPGDERIWAFTRRLGTTELLVVANLSDGPAEAAIPASQDWAGAEMILSNYPSPTRARPAGKLTDFPSVYGPRTAGINADITLRAWEARVYRHSRRPELPVS